MINKSLGLNIDTNQAHGDITGLTDSNGDVVATYNYDEFGNLISSTGSIYNPLRYSGANNAYYDSETGFYKMGCRYYMAEVGRWLTRDIAEASEYQPQTLHKYLYTKNNPIKYIDPTGMMYMIFNGYNIKIYNNKGHIIKGVKIHGTTRAITGNPRYGWETSNKGPIPPGNYVAYNRDG